MNVTKSLPERRVPEFHYIIIFRVALGENEVERTGKAKTRLDMSSNEEIQHIKEYIHIS